MKLLSLRLLAVIAATILVAPHAKAQVYPPCKSITPINIDCGFQPFETFDTGIVFQNNSHDTISYSGFHIVILSGDSEVLQDLSSFEGPLYLLPGTNYSYPVVFNFDCFKKNLYSGIIGAISASDSSICEIGTFKFHRIYSVTDSIYLNIPANSDTIKIAPRNAASEHDIYIRNSGTDTAFLSALQINDTNDIATFDSTGNASLTLHDTLAPDSSIQTSVTILPKDTGINLIHFQLIENGTIQNYTLTLSVSGRSISDYPLYVSTPAFDTLHPKEQVCKDIYISNDGPDTLTNCRILLEQNSSSGVVWSLDTSGLDTLAPAGIFNSYYTFKMCAEDTSSDTIPTTAIVKVLFNSPCGADSITTPEYGKPASASGSASVNTVPKLPFQFSLFPNPSQSEVTIALPQGTLSLVEIYDVLGNLLFKKQTTGDVIWSGETPNGNSKPGMYFVRCESLADGSHSSKLLILQ